MISTAHRAASAPRRTISRRHKRPNQQRRKSPRHDQHGTMGRVRTEAQESSSRSAAGTRGRISTEAQGPSP